MGVCATYVVSGVTGEYDAEQYHSLPAVVCSSCSDTKPQIRCVRRSPALGALVVANRNVLKAYVVDVLHRSVELTSVRRSVVGFDVRMLLLDCVRALKQQHPTMTIRDDDRNVALQECSRLLLPHAHIDFGRLWDSVLFDLLPHVIPSVISRPVHVLRGDDGLVRLSAYVPDPAPETPFYPVVLAYSCYEFGCDHYDVVL